MNILTATPEKCCQLLILPSTKHKIVALRMSIMMDRQESVKNPPAIILIGLKQDASEPAETRVVDANNRPKGRA
jgi:hypothetical protein